jgi:hypothetical protein
MNGLRGGGEIMKLFRTAFWLGVVVYNLPNTSPETAAPPSQVHDAQRPAANAANSRVSEKLFQDTLTPADRKLPWRGLARNHHISKRST